MTIFLDIDMQPLHGFSLIEVLISMVLLAVLLLGLDIMEISALRTNRETYFFAVAANQLQIMEDRLSVIVDKQDIAQQTALWNRENALALPGGRGTLNQSTLSVFWGSATQDNCQQKQEGQSGCLSKTISLQG